MGCNGLSETEPDYLEDGIKYCGSCHTPKQCRVQMGGRDWVMPVLCDCERERENEEKRLRAEQKHRQRVDELLRTGLPDGRYRSITFERMEYVPEFARRYVEDWERNRRENLGLMLMGGVGTGKTWTAAGIANALIDREIPVHMENILSVVDRMTGLYSSDRPEMLAELERAPLLILDDFGAQRGTEFVKEQIYHIIESRYRSGKPLIVTTNLSLEEMRRDGDLWMDRVYDRLREICHPVVMQGESWRRKNANARYRKINERLGL